MRFCSIIGSARWLVERVNSLTIARAVKNETRFARYREENVHEKADNRMCGDAWAIVFRTLAGVSAKLAAEADQDDSALPGRRRHRFRRADGGGSSVEAVEPTDLRREPRRRQRRCGLAGAQASRS